ncbi:hypothetical protein FRB94_006676 [Tulasnella sp. JGI-2019a]|nr:hypothetical protein FRB94_006676 [Tulasnella sp. JGI-2019a]
MLLANVNAGTITDSIATLDAFCQKFDVSRDIEGAVQLAQIATGVTLVQQNVQHSRDEIKVMRSDVIHVQATVDNVNGTLNNIKST